MNPCSVDILLVDDDPDILDAFGLAMEDQGYAVLTACNGQQALDLLRHHVPRLITMDLMMPLVSGWQLLDELAGDGRLCRIPVLVCAARPLHAANLKPGQVAAYLEKPVDLTVFISTVTTLSQQVER